MRGKKTTAISPVKVMAKILKKQGISNISFGIIVSVKGKKDHRVTVKHTSESGAHMLTVTGKMYKQEVRIYDDVSPEVILGILNKELGESYRVL